jgi:3-oxoacyl-[acyl-carrier-protein] synthase III
MYVWTKKAETDYRAKHPHRKNERKAGTKALWYGEELSNSFVEGYAERGWIVEMVANKPKKIKLKKKSKASIDGHGMTKEQKRKRWGQLMFWFGQPNKYSIDDIVEKLGLRSHGAVNSFVRKYGIELAQKYGKLPYKEGLRMPIWTQVMEAKA